MYLQETQVKNIIRDYMLQIKAVIIAIMCFSFTAVMLHRFVDQSNPVINEFMAHASNVFFLMLIGMLILHFSPRRFEYFVPFMLSYVMYMIIEVSMAADTYRVSEYFISGLGFVFVCVIVIPLHWKLNSLIF